MEANPQPAGISVVICTHNPRMDYLGRVLKALEEQTLGRNHWELVIVDNGSRSDLKAVLEIAWHPAGRIVREDQLGLASARMRGIRESQREVLVFVDDDNVLESDYLAQCHRIASEWPQLGVWGGSLNPEFETAPPDHLRPYLKSLALRTVQSATWSNVWDCAAAEPYGAGLCVRREVALKYRDSYQQSTLSIGDRTGKSLLSGGDTEIAYVSCSLGLGMAVFPELRLTHLIPSGRLEEDYLVKLAEGISTSSIVLKYKWKGIVPVSPYSPLVILRLLKYCFSRSAIKRRLSWASFRARIAARRIIAGAKEARSGANEPNNFLLDTQ